MLKQTTDTLLRKEMDRRDFLRHVGLAVVALSGQTVLLRTLVDQPIKQSTGSSADPRGGYGSSAYGR